MQNEKKIKGISYAKWGYIFILPFFLTYAIFSLIPLADTISRSFFENYYSGLKEIGPNWVGFANYIELLAADLPKYAWNTFVMWILGFVPQIVIALILASWFTDARLKIRGKQFFKVVIYLPNLIMAAIMGINPSIFEAAELDGCTSTQKFFKITLPQIKPLLTYTLITSFIGGLQMFDVPQILTGGQGAPDRTTMTLIMYLNNHLQAKNYGMAGALSVYLFLISGVLCWIVFKMNTDPDNAKAAEKRARKLAKKGGNA